MKPAPEQESASRITNETVAEHREQILAGGRKFKYPVQYSKHKLVINSVLIVLVSVVILSALIWWQLYPAQNTSKFMYRITQLLPLPVAQVDGEYVRYSDYLKRYRSSVHFLEKQFNLNTGTTDGERQVAFIKRDELNRVEYDAYVRKLAREAGVSISEKEVDGFIQKDLDATKISLEAYERSVLGAFYDLTLNEYRENVRMQLLTRKVSFTIDAAAKAKAEHIMAELGKGSDFTALAKVESDDEATKPSGGDVGSIPRTNVDPDGVIATVSALEPGGVTALLTGADGYYVAKLVAKNDSTVQYQIIKIAFTELDKRFEVVKKDSKIKEYIEVKSQ